MPRAKKYKWLIEKTDNKGNLKYFGTFEGNEKAYAELKEMMETCLDTSGWWNDSMRFTKQD